MNQAQTISSAALGAANTFQRGVRRFALLERALAVACLSTPAWLILFDDGKEIIRESISAYFDMGENQIFYVPLTVVAMLFVVNGVVKAKHAYNGVLGVLLAGFLVFNHKDFEIPHAIFATTFFVGNALVILLYSSSKQRSIKALIVLGIVMSLLGHFVFGWYSLFWAEWLSLAIIALHFVLESRGVLD